MKLKIQTEKEIELKEGDVFTMHGWSDSFMTLRILGDRVICIPLSLNRVFDEEIGHIHTFGKSLLEKKYIQLVEEGREKKDEQYIPKLGEIYWYIIDFSDCAETSSTAWESDHADIFRLHTNNCFKTQEEAEAYFDKIMGKEK